MSKTKALTSITKGPHYPIHMERAKSYSGNFIVIVLPLEVLMFFPFSKGGNVIATLDSQVERITEETKVLLFKAKTIKDRNYIATVNFPEDLPIQIKLCKLYFIGNIFTDLC